MALNNIGLGFLVETQDLSSRSILGIAKAFKSLEARALKSGINIKSGLKQIAAGAVATKVGIAGLQGAFGLAGASEEFIDGIAAVKAVTKASRAEVDLLTKSALDAGIATQFSPDQATEGLLSLATAGQTARDATQSLVPVLDLAAGSLGQLGVGQAAEAVVGTLNSYQMGAEKAAEVTDKLLRVTQLTNFQTRDFQIGLSKSAAAGAVFGTKLDDVLILMGQLRNANIDASSASTAVREALRRIGSDKGAQKALKKLGVNAFTASGQARSVIDVLQDMVVATGKLTEKEKNRRVAQVLGARGLLAFNAIQQASFTTFENGEKVVLRGQAALTRLRKEMADSKGTAAGFRAEMLSTFKGQKTLLQGTIQTLGVAFGRPLAAALAPVVGFVTTVLNKLVQGFLALPEPVQNAIGILGLLTVTFVTLAGATIAVRGAMLLLGPSIRTMAAAALPALLPFIKIIAVIGAVVAAVTLLKIMFDKNIGGFGDSMREVWAELSPVLEELKQAFIDAITALASVFRPLLPILKFVGNLLVKFIILNIKILVKIIQLAAFGIGLFAKALTFVFTKAAQGFAIVRGEFDKVGAMISRVADSVREAWGRLMEFLRPVFEWIEAQAEKVQKIIDKIEKVGSRTVSFVKRKFFGEGGATLADLEQSEFLPPEIRAQIRQQRLTREAETGTNIERLTQPLALAAAGGGTANITVKSELSLDGEKVGEAMERRKVELQARRSE